MECTQIPLGMLQTNCYILKNEENECIIVDPGSEGDKLLSYLEKEQLKPLAILLTHAHFDHIGAVDTVKEQFQIPVYIHKKEAHWLKDPSLNGSERFAAGHGVTANADHFISGEGPLEIGCFVFTVMETPGHSPGSVSYYQQDLNLVFAGDTLFQASIGRTDLQDGNHDQLLESIHKKLLTLPEETTVLPGHGPATTIQNEMDMNPFLNGY